MSLNKDKNFDTANQERADSHQNRYGFRDIFTWLNEGPGEENRAFFREIVASPTTPHRVKITALILGILAYKIDWDH